MAGARAVVRRAAYDIGSGAVKLMVCDVDPRRGMILRTLFAEERPVKYAIDWQQSADGSLSESIRRAGAERLLELARTARALDATETAAVATEVFRKAKNGAAHLQQLADVCGVVPQLISQREEAEIGYLTAAAFRQEGDPASIIAWDSGGASFQITTEAEGGLEAGLRAYVAPIGSGVALGMMVRDVLKREMRAGATPNPCTREDAQRLVRHLQSVLPEPPEWLAGSGKVVAIGGPNSLFAECARVLRLPSERTSITTASAKAALDELCGQSDLQLEVGYEGPATGRDPVSMMVPKLALLVAVLELAALRSFVFQPCVGSCAGMMLHRKLFPPQPPSGRL